METLAAKVEKFKLTLVKAESIADAWTYFFDHLLSDDRFTGMQREVVPTEVLSVLETVTDHAIKNKKGLRHLLSFEIPEYKIVHGSCAIDSIMIPYCVAQDLNVGTVCVMEHPHPPVKLLRFSVSPGTKSCDIKKAFAFTAKSSRLH
ncbi:MAG: hypothetical protein ACR2HF_12665 [Methylococcaceae bacterium]